MSTPARLMDNHKGAFLFWQELGITDATCVHVDAHLDVSNFHVPEPGDLDHPELNCGNFLYPAMRDGTVRHLVWVMPPHLSADTPLLTWAQQELQNWMWLSLSEYRSLHLAEGRVEGMLAGQRLTICTADRVPSFSTPVLVDIDVDYFFGPTDAVWQTPMALYDAMQHLIPAALTVAASVEGGYTPPQHRYCANLSYLCWIGQRAAADTWWRYIRHDEAAADPPSWAQAARLAVAAHERGEAYAGPGWDGAAAVHEDYRIRPLDVASFYLHRKAFDRSLPWLSQVEGSAHGLDRLTADYLRGLVAWREGRSSEADACWSQVMEAPGLPPLVIAHLAEMRSKVLASIQQHEAAMSQVRTALRHDPQNASLWRQLGQIQVAAGQLEQGARSYRKGVALAPEELATLPIRLALAEGYAAAGQTLLAQAELHHLLRQDAGLLTAKARRLAMSLQGGASELHDQGG